MPKLITSSSIAIVLLLACTGTSHAQAVVIEGERALITKWANYAVPGILFSSNTHRVITPSGNIQLTTVFQFHPALAPPKAVVTRGFVCRVGVGKLSTNSQAIVTPSGRVILTCIYKP